MKIQKNRDFSVSQNSKNFKILAIGDFHGKFPEKLKRKIREEKFDLILSTGDYFPWSLKKKFFQKVFGKNVELWEVVSKKKYKEAIMNDLKLGEERVIKKLNSLGIPIFITIGNYDNAPINDQYPKRRFFSEWKWVDKDFFSPVIKKHKNIKRIDYSFAKFDGFIFIGAFGHSSPGFVRSFAYKKHRKKLESLFNKFRKENKEKRVIFLFHNMPYNTKLDIIKSKEAHKLVKGEHYGSKLIKRIIDKYQPVLAIGGHMHENAGKQKLGKTLVVNPGAASEGKAAIITIEKNKVKNVRFLR